MLVPISPAQEDAPRLQEEVLTVKRVYMVPGSLQRVCQLTGEHDRTARVPVPSLTESAAHLLGTDLGSSVDLGDRLIFLFGDSPPRADLGDTFGSTTATAPAHDLRLTFPVDEFGSFRPFTLMDPSVPNRTTGEFEVPTGGFAVDGKLYVVYSQGSSKAQPMHSSVMCSADDPNDLTRLTVLYEVSSVVAKPEGHFVNVAPVVHRSRSTSPWMVYFWGSGAYRRSDIYLARVPLELIEIRAAWRYWTGRSWSVSESTAKPIFPVAVEAGEGVGELSAAWLAPLRRWIVTYQIGPHPTGVWFRTASSPTGPYSDARLLYHPEWPGVGFGTVLHRPWSDGAALGTDLLYDRGQGEMTGTEYGAYIVSRFTRALTRDRVSIAFTLSSWNPYQVHLFTASLELSDGPGPPEPGVQPAFVAEASIATVPGGVSMMVSTFGPNNFELAAPAFDGGLLLRSRENTKPGIPWDGVARIGLGPLGQQDPVHYGGVSMIQSGLSNRGDVVPDRLGRFYVAARTGDRIVYLWREAAPPFDWHGPFPVIAVEPDDRRFHFAGASGNPVLVRSHFGDEHMNWELIAPAAGGGGLIHFWRNHTTAFPKDDDWHLATPFMQEVGHVDAVTMIESELVEGLFALEVIARVGGQLWFAWRSAALHWAGAARIDVSWVVAIAVSGVPSLIQSKYGQKRRNFELVSPLAGGGLLHLWRDNVSDDPAQWRWRPAGPVLDTGRRYNSASLLQGPMGVDPGNLEMVARTEAGEVFYFWRSALTFQWSAPVRIPL
jgi:hypothetical protein